MSTDIQWDTPAKRIFSFFRVKIPKYNGNCAHCYIFYIYFYFFIVFSIITRVDWSLYFSNLCWKLSFFRNHLFTSRTESFILRLVLLFVLDLIWHQGIKSGLCSSRPRFPGFFSWFLTVYSYNDKPMILALYKILISLVSVQTRSTIIL